MKHLKFFESFNSETDIESELNIVDIINRNEINGDVPIDAQYAALNPTEKFIQKFYRFKDIKVNDGSIHKSFQYWGEQGGWHGSEFNQNGKDYSKLNTQKFLKIVD